MTNADNPENTVPTSVFASFTLNAHRRALTATTDYGTDPFIWLWLTFGGDGGCRYPSRMRWRRSVKPARPCIW
ncbi:hypothetical protein, partial [Streptomyces wuyuanensis]|uniref:hypothetical protein n=1 Tax=Streptomyces wuyuanensis TaxID=1196353 RepID=UPI00341BFDD4